MDKMDQSPMSNEGRSSWPPRIEDPARDSAEHRNGPRGLQLPPIALPYPENESPVTELAPIQPPHEKPAASSAPTLPPLSSVTGPLPNPPEPSHPPPFSNRINHWPSLNPFTAYYSPSHLDPIEPSPSMASSMGSDRGDARRSASVSLDDPDVRIAAEALGNLRADSGSSPRNHTSSWPTTSGDFKAGIAASRSSGSNGSKQPEPEPLLSLITTSHPLLATTIEGAASAYNSGKNYSPHLKTGAEYVESYLNPVAKAVGNVGRKTGVEGGVRWIFGRRSRKQQAAPDIEAGDRGNHKRRKAEPDESSHKGPIGLTPYFDASTDDRRMSVSTVDTLPAYDDQTSPAYTETADGQMLPGPGAGASGQQPWSRRLVVTTSGLGIAMKQESLRSLKYCLGVLRDTNGYINELLVTLKATIDEYDRETQRDGQEEAMAGGQQSSAQPASAATRSRLIQRMGKLKDDLFRAIQRTVETVSKYAGSALPENARNLVHRQLLSLPGLYKQLHNTQAATEGRRENRGPETLARDRSHLALIFAREALQLMTQVADVLNRTLVSAEEWCETLYRRRQEQQESASAEGAAAEARPTPAPAPAAIDRDLTMSG